MNEKKNALIQTILKALGVILAAFGVYYAGTILNPPVAWNADPRPWKWDVSKLPKHPRSDTWLNDAMGAGVNIHNGWATWWAPKGGPDKQGSNDPNEPDAALNGMVPVKVPCGQPRVKIVFDNVKESDPGPYPFPKDVPIQGVGKDLNAGGDRHVLVEELCTPSVYWESWDTHRLPDGTFKAGSGAKFLSDGSTKRPKGYTSADAAGLPITPYLINCLEMALGPIQHVTRVTNNFSSSWYIYPATHAAPAGCGTDLKCPPMGAWGRMKADYDCSKLHPMIRNLCGSPETGGWKKFGFVVADNGSKWDFAGVADPVACNDVILAEMKLIKGDAFEFVDTGFEITKWP